MALAQREGLKGDFKAVPEGQDYVPIADLLAVYETADEQLKPGFSVRQGCGLQSEDYDTLGLAWRTCLKAKDIFLRLQRFMILVTDYGATHLLEAEGRIRVELERPAGRRGEEMANETAMVMLVNILREVTGESLSPTRVDFQHGERAKDNLEAFFKAPVHFMSRGNYLQFKQADLEKSTMKADKHLQEYLVARMQEELAYIDTESDPLLKGIQTFIQESLPSGIPSLVNAAEQVNLAPRTLKRRLATQGYSFRELVQDMQAQSAKYYLKHSEKSISEITFLTGFSEQSAFNRAFKRWTGQSPSQFRKAI